MGIFLSCCIVGYVHFLLGDQLTFSKFLHLVFLSLSLRLFISPSFLSAPHPPSHPPSSRCYLLCFVIAAAPPCLYSCYASTCDDFHLFAEVYTELDVPNLLINPQIPRADRRSLRAQISTLASHLKEWCHCVDKLVISWWLLRENV